MTLWPSPRWAQVGSFRLAYREWRPRVPRAPTLLLIHGLGSSGLVWSRTIEHLRDRFHVVVPDLPGFGESDKPRYRFTIPFYASKMVGLLDQLGITRCGWVGHSMGGHIAVWAAMHHPDRVESLVLAAPAGFERFSEREAHVLRSTVTPGWVRRQGRRQLTDALKLAFSEVPSEAAVLLDYRLRMKGPELDGFAHAFARGVHAMLDHPLQNVQVSAPTHVVFGADDQLVPNRVFRPQSRPDDLARYAARSLGATHALIERAGHLLPFERPQQFADEITKIR